jgi:hypothetical protein
MFAPFTLVIAMAAAAPQTQQITAAGVEVRARTTQENGETSMTSLFTFPGDLRAPQTMFVYAPHSVCDGVFASKDEPSRALYGWRIFMGPVTYAAGSRAPLRADVMLTTHRMWSAGAKESDAPLFLALPTQSSERSGVIDTVSAPRPVDGCKASSVTLEARLLPHAPAPRPADTLVEAELWFVHKAPDGKETTERQAVRMRDGGRGDFYFDDMTLTLSGEGFTTPIAVEVFGSIHTGMVDADGDIDITLYLTRRYINKAAVAFGVWPKVGKTEYPTTVKAGEVVSFVLPPLADDGGIFLGHRFSVRLRLKPVGDEASAPLSNQEDVPLIAADWTKQGEPCPK